MTALYPVPPRPEGGAAADAFTADLIVDFAQPPSPWKWLLAALVALQLVVLTQAAYGSGGFVDMNRHTRPTPTLRRPVRRESRNRRSN